MDAAHQYAVHMLGLFLLAGAAHAEASHPAVWLGALALAALPALSDLDDLRWGRR